jgi:FAD/FMN-containing dehydrogenase
MKFSTSVWSISIAVLSYSPKTTLAASNKTVSTPAGCRVLPGDVEWPSAEVWKKELPNAIPRSRFQSPFSSTHPNYRVSATTVQEVQNAVRFATKHNLRLSIINSGHDYMGRNDAPNGLWLDVSNLLGVRVLESFQPTEQGQPDPDPSGKVNGITPIPGTQAAATFGPGLSAVELNQALKASKVFAISGAARK